MDADDWEDLIDSEAQKPASMASDAGKVERKSAADLIALDRHAAGKRARANASPFMGGDVRQLQQPGGG